MCSTWSSSNVSPDENYWVKSTSEADENCKCRKLQLQSASDYIGNNLQKHINSAFTKGYINISTKKYPFCSSMRIWTVLFLLRAFLKNLFLGKYHSCTSFSTSRVQIQCCILWPWKNNLFVFWVSVSVQILTAHFLPCRKSFSKLTLILYVPQDLVSRKDYNVSQSVYILKARELINWNNIHGFLNWWYKSILLKINNSWTSHLWTYCEHPEKKIRCKSILIPGTSYLS